LRRVRDGYLRSALYQATTSHPNPDETDRA